MVLNRYDVVVNGETVMKNSLLPSVSEVQKNASDFVFAFRVNKLFQKEVFRIVEGVWSFYDYQNDHTDDEAYDQ